MMEAVSTSETSVNFYQTTQPNIPEDGYIRICTLFGILKSKRVTRAGNVAEMRRQKFTQNFCEDLLEKSTLKTGTEMEV
jgi:hypothetical protein